MANHIHHGKDKRGRRTAEERRRTGAPRDPSEEDPGGQTGTGGQSAGEKRRTGSGDTEGQGSVQLQSRINAGRQWHDSGYNARRQSKAAKRALRNHSREAPNRVHPLRQKGRGGNPSLRVGITSVDEKRPFLSFAEPRHRRQQPIDGTPTS